MSSAEGTYRRRTSVLERHVVPQAVVSDSPREIMVGKKMLPLNGTKAGWMKDSTGDFRQGDFSTLRGRLAEDGYLLLRGVIDRNAVLAAGDVAKQAVADEYAAGRVNPSLRHVFLGMWAHASHATVSATSNPPPRNHMRLCAMPTQVILHGAATQWSTGQWQDQSCTTCLTVCLTRRLSHLTSNG